MKSSTDYIPSGDADRLRWAQNFSTRLTAAPATFGLTAPDAVIVAGFVAAFASAYVLSTNPTTRTPATVAAKDAASAALLESIRPYAVGISKATGVTNSAKATIGVTVAVQGRGRIGIGGTRLDLHLKSATPECLLVTAANPATPRSKKRPRGARGFELEIQISTQADVPFSTATVIATKSEYNIPPDADWHGKKFRIRARWIGASLQGGAPNSGDWSNAIRGNVP